MFMGATRKPLTLLKINDSDRENIFPEKYENGTEFKSEKLTQTWDGCDLKKKNSLMIGIGQEGYYAMSTIDGVLKPIKMEKGGSDISGTAEELLQILHWSARENPNAIDHKKSIDVKNIDLNKLLKKLQEYTSSDYQILQEALLKHNGEWAKELDWTFEPAPRMSFQHSSRSPNHVIDIG